MKRILIIPKHPDLVDITTPRVMSTLTLHMLHNKNQRERQREREKQQQEDEILQKQNKNDRQ